MKEIQLGGNRYSNKPVTGYALVDDEDFDELNQYVWCLNDGYACTNIKVGGARTAVRMHRMVMGYPKSRIDHKDGNRANNQRSNLRLVTHAQNLMNRGATRNSTTGYKGVCLRKDTLKYQAFIRAQGIRYSLGCFNTAEEAALAYNTAALELHGEYAFQNVLQLSNN